MSGTNLRREIITQITGVEFFGSNFTYKLNDHY